MTPPEWFRLISQWQQEGMGENGPTLPFVVGAIAVKHKITQAGRRGIESILDAIANNPFEDHFTFVFWCPHIDAPVMEVKPINFPYTKNFAFLPRAPGFPASLAFGANLQARWNSHDATALAEHLVTDALTPVISGNYSRQRKPKTIDFEYGPFNVRDLEYIKRTIVNTP